MPPVPEQNPDLDNMTPEEIMSWMESIYGKRLPSPSQPFQQSGFSPEEWDENGLPAQEA